MLDPAVHVAATVVIALVVWWLVRAIWRISPTAAQVAGGVVSVRLALSVAMYFTSKWNLPVLRGLHTGDGFWTLGPDSRLYYELGLVGMQEGLWAIAPGTPSPSYTRLLAIWLWLLGPSQLVAAVLNAVLYLLMVWVLVRWALTPQRRVSLTGVLVSVGALSLSPSLTISSTQILKDVYFAVLLVGFVLVARAWLPAFRDFLVRGAASGMLWRGGAALLVATLLISGVRAYYGIFVIAGVCLATVAWTVAPPVKFVVPRVLALGAVTGALWVAFATGAGLYYEPYHRIAAGVVDQATSVLPAEMIPRWDSGQQSSIENPTMIGSLDAVRQGFVRSGGNTSIVRRPGSAGAATTLQGDEPTDGTREWGGSGRIRSTLIGLAVMFVPLTLLEPLGLVDVSLGPVRTYIADVDTAFMLATVLLLCWFVWSSRSRVVWDRALVILLCSSAFISLTLVAYIVTNVGTLTRLRVPALVFLWLLPLAAGVRSHQDEPSGPSRTRTAGAD